MKSHTRTVDKLLERIERLERQISCAARGHCFICGGLNPAGKLAFFGCADCQVYYKRHSDELNEHELALANVFVKRRVDSQAVVARRGVEMLDSEIQEQEACIATLRSHAKDAKSLETRRNP